MSSNVSQSCPNRPAVPWIVCNTLCKMMKSQAFVRLLSPFARRLTEESTFRAEDLNWLSRSETFNFDRNLNAPMRRIIRDFFDSSCVVSAATPSMTAEGAPWLSLRCMRGSSSSVGKNDGDHGLKNKTNMACSLADVWNDGAPVTSKSEPKSCFRLAQLQGTLMSTVTVDAPI